MVNFFCKFMKYCFDSRDVGPGDCFLALKGERVDGHDFLQQVAERGARYAWVQADYAGEDFGLELVRKSDVLLALQDEAKEAISWREECVIGVTGSVGKTMTKEFIATLLAEKYTVAKSEKSHNSQITMATTILNSPPSDVLVLEMGMSFPGEMEKLVSIAQPHIAVLTNVSASHLAHFSNVEEIGREKGEIFKSERLRRSIVCEQCEIYAPRNATIYQTAMSPFVENLNAAIDVALEMGLTDAQIVSGIDKLSQVEHRFEKKVIDGITFIDDAYNASEVSTMSALNNLPKGRGVMIFADIREVGKGGKSVHERVAERAVEVCDELYCIGEESKVMIPIFAREGKRANWFDTKKMLVEALKLLEGDVVLVKGSNSFRMWEVIDDFVALARM